MAEADEDSAEILKYLENERQNKDENAKQEHLVTDTKYTEEELVENCQITAENPKEKINSDDKVVLNVSGLAESKAPLDNNAKLSSNKLCNNSKITLSEKLWIHDKSPSASSKRVKDNFCKANFGNEDEEDTQEIRDVEWEKSPELTKSSEKNQIHDKYRDKSVLIQNSECKNSVERKLGNNGFSDTKKLSEEKSSSTTCSSKQDDNEDSKNENEEKDDLETEGEEEDSEDSPLMRTRRETDTTETETEDSDHDFPTEGLLKELHFLNASCERPLVEKNAVLQIHKTPKKQRKLNFGNLLPEDITPTKIVNQRVSPRKRNRSSTPSPDKPLQLVTGLDCKKFKIPSSTPFKFKKSQEKFDIGIKQCYGEASDDESDDGEGGLTIVAQDDIPKKRKGMISPARSKKKVRGVDGDVPQEVIELIQSGIDEVLEEKAERTRLTAIHVKNIIKNVMTDENVLAMVRNTILGIHGKGAETSAVYEQTLTRAKTKELMEQQAAGVGSGNIWAGLSNSSAGGSTSLNPETQALATTDFPEEDEDEEYHPDVDEHFLSDDESLVSTGVGSETGSPVTPCTPSSCVYSTPGSFNSLNTPQSCRMSTPRNQRLMVLKMPSAQKKNVQRILDFETVKNEEEVVSQRTRSKLPLTETPLECLEMAFKPPDVTNDMYETEVDNEDWKTFLIDFIHPLKNPEAGEDEEADPEYNILEDKEDALDLKEEMRGDRAVQISKKEINELMIELFDTLGKSEGTDTLRAHLSQNSQKEAKKSQFKTSQACQPSENKDDPSFGAIWVDVLTAEFTKDQLQILQCQMIQHVQLLATSSLLCYGTSPLTYVANGCLEHLESLKKNAEESEFKKSFFRPFNLEPALEALKSIQVKTADNLVSDAHPESCSADLNPIVIETILESSAFPYPRLLPIRMFKHQNTRGSKKAVFVKSEDMLIALGLERYLDPKYHKEKCRKSQPHQLLEALSMTVENILVGKTLSQATNRIKNIRCRANVAPNNPVLKYLETGHLDLPAAEIEPSLPCVPCPVQNFPESSLKEPYQKIVQKRNTVLKRMIQEVSLKAAFALEREEREAKFRGATSLPKSIQNIVIIQSSGGGRQIPESPASANPYTAYSCIVDSSVIHESPSVSLSKIHVVRMPNLPSSKCKAQIDSFNQSGYPSHINRSTPAGNCKTESTDNQSSAKTIKENAETVSTNLVPSNSESTLVSYKDQESSIVFVDSAQDEECNRKNIDEANPISPMKTSELESKPLKSNVELNESVNKNGDSIQCTSEEGENHAYDKAVNGDKKKGISQKHGDDLDSGITSDTESLPDLTERPKESKTFGEIRKKKKSKTSCTSSVDRIESGELDIVPRMPPRAYYNTPPDTPSAYEMPSFLTTPDKSNEKDGFASSLHTPVVPTSPSRSLTTPVKILREIKQTDLSSILGKSEMELTNISSVNENNSAPSTSHTSCATPGVTGGSLNSSIPVPPREGNKGTKYNEKENNDDAGKTSFSGKCNLVLQNTALQDENGTPERISTLPQASSQSSSITLVTSVYPSPIFSAGVDEASPLNLIHISPQKTKATYRKISPAKNFRSPIKTSPLKQVSPILRKYHKYSKKRHLMSSTKLSPILPKISDKSKTPKRRLAPKLCKTTSAVHDSIRGRHSIRATGQESFLHGSKDTGDGDLLQLDDELMDGNTSLSSTCNLSRPSAQVHQTEEEFEEFSLEDEDEEDEDEEEEDEEEEEDLEAAQQREEHLAALLKASSTITLRRSGGGDGFDKRLSSVEDLGQGERKLTKQQRRLQARITSLSYVPDTVTQNKFMAQSYLMRVRETLLLKGPSAFKEFLCILNEFTENPSMSPLQLYDQLCEVLNDYPHLTEEFVSFLFPQQAMTLGKFAQYCAITRMRDFLEKLELQFCKQPKYIQKIIRLLQTMQNDPNLNIEEVKAAMIPLLKYPHLVECFTQCFPSQPPPPSLQSDFEDVSLENPGTPDSMESLVLPDEDSHTSPNQCLCPCHVSASSPPTSNPAAQSTTTANSGHHNHCRSCALRFSDGRIYLQCGKTLRPAKVTYQTADVKNEEFYEKSAHGQAAGGNVNAGNDCSETSTKVKSLGKGKSYTKDSNDNTHVRSKENTNKVVSNSSSNNTAHVNNSSMLKSRTVILSEERCSKDDIGNQGEKIDNAVRIRGDNVDSVTEMVSKNIENICCKNECILEGKNHNVKKTCVNRSYEKTEENSCTHPTYSKCAGHSRAGLGQTNMRLLKGKVNTDSASNSVRHKEFSFLPCSSPKEVLNEYPVLRSCSNTNSHNFCAVGELLNEHVNVIDERKRPNASAMIITDKAQLQKEHKAAFCHIPIKIFGKTTETQQSSNSNLLLTKEAAFVINSGGNTNSHRTYLQHCSLSSDSKSSDSTSCSSSASYVKNLVNQSTSNTEAKRLFRNLAEGLDSSPGKSSLSSSSVSSVSVTPTTPSSCKYVSWTKEEDRMILTVIQQKGANDIVFQEIADALPSRDYHEVFDRFNVLVRLMMDETDIEDSMSVSSEDSTI